MRRRPEFSVPQLAAIFLGGAAGALLRTQLSHRFAVGPDAWPWAIFAMNLAGAALLGGLVALLEDFPDAHPLWRPVIGPGFCGALTTFSTLQLQILTLVRHGHGWLALAYACASIAAGLLVVDVVSWVVHRIAAGSSGRS